ncbi:MAG: phosphatase PAP2 family protein [Legionella sp.]|nr:phosphatase PAP2 family protein [Legionella sp.]
MRFECWFAAMRRTEIMILMTIITLLSYLYVDKSLAAYCHGFDFRDEWPWLLWITFLGGSKIWVPSLFISALFFRYVLINSCWEMRSWFLFFCIAIPDTLCWLLKMTLGRARPVLWFNEQLFGFYGWQQDPTFWSFPSGHTTTIMGCVFGLSILFPKYIRAWLLMGFVVSCSRILLTYHYVSDILVAGYLTLLEVGVIFAMMQRKGWLKLAWANPTYLTNVAVR